MPKGVLVFDLGSEKQDFELAQRARDIAIAIEELDREMRNVTKYEELPECLKGKGNIFTVTEYWRMRLNDLVGEP
tara:strand:+ start:455 stop:679 length:225 start_codon:yes stop_codon:yes gene_type:complete